ncbi:glycosyltransferase family 2 protein [Aquirufa ecclesiirivi]|uniref:glycosyltransferase family 2 protein n=1 Tax=Aquirufa ecclesiirivi TaxID=2715124 RepID=UPI00140C544C|nr:glycosyltransferase family 2 protein [Aquirufa ecclesiirivi]NHC48157.1 glycosyltransferase [Aquirufa ecclesiirivi]
MNLEDIKVSIIISVLNAEKTIESCLESIIKQDHKNIEIIVIDGGSTDSTLHILERFAQKIDYFLSEPDFGIYDAWNKALNQVTGDWICFIGADDVIICNGIIEMLKLIDEDGINLISARVMLVNDLGEDVAEIGKSWDYLSLKRGLGIVHCGALHHASLFQNEKFDINYKIAGDFEFLLRIGPNIKARFLNKTIVRMFNGGSSRKHVNRVINETYRAILICTSFTKLDAMLFLINSYLREYIRTFFFQFTFGHALFNYWNKNTVNN